MTKYSLPKVRSYVKTVVQYLYTTRAKTCQTAQCQKVREMAGTLARYVSETDAPKPKADPLVVLAGYCPCGQEIKIGEQYMIPAAGIGIMGTTNIDRACPGCDRTNTVSLHTSAEVYPANWHIFDCDCGAGIYLRSDYMGGPDFGGPGFIQYADQRRNRTVKHPCRRCGCRWRIVIRFARGEDKRYTRRCQPFVTRCDRCHARKERTDNASA